MLGYRNRNIAFILFLFFFSFMTAVINSRPSSSAATSMGLAKPGFLFASFFLFEVYQVYLIKYYVFIIFKLNCSLSCGTNNIELHFFSRLER